VDPTLPSGSPFEVFDRICYLAFSTINLDLSQGSDYDCSCRSNEGRSGKILLVAGLFAYEHQIGTSFTLSKNHLRRTKVKRATTTFPCCSSKFQQIARFWNSRLLDLVPVCRNPRVRIGNRFQQKGSPHQKVLFTGLTATFTFAPSLTWHPPAQIRFSRDPAARLRATCS
jgi:hypothetical protein